MMPLWLCSCNTLRACPSPYHPHCCHQDLLPAILPSAPHWPPCFCPHSPNSPFLHAAARHWLKPKSDDIPPLLRTSLWFSSPAEAKAKSSTCSEGLEPPALMPLRCCLPVLSPHSPCFSCTGLSLFLHPIEYFSAGSSPCLEQSSPRCLHGSLPHFPIPAQRSVRPFLTILFKTEFPSTTFSATLPPASVSLHSTHCLSSPSKTQCPRRQAFCLSTVVALALWEMVCLCTQ